MTSVGSATPSGPQIVHLTAGGYCGGIGPANNSLHLSLGCGSSDLSLVLNGPSS